MTDKNPLFDINDFIDFSQRASVGLTRRIPSGPVHMGSRFHPRESMGQVYVREFEIGHSPVTVSQYENFINSRAVNEEQWWSEEGWAWRQGELPGWGRVDRSRPDGWAVQKRRFDHPVTGITYYEAEAYCRWLSDIKKISTRLPTEEEWTRAARGEDKRPFPWGEDFDERSANTIETERGKTVTSGSTSGDVSPFGVHDMAGNVQEWTTSLYQPFEDENYAADVLYVVKGGSYNDTAYGSRTTYRRAYPAGYYFSYLGFRVVVGMR